MTRRMKNCCIRPFIKRGLGLVLAALCLTGCTSPAQEPETLRVGVAVYLQSDTFISSLVQDLERQVPARETADGIKINLNIVDGRGSQITQNEQIDRLIALDYDVLCVNLVDRTSAAPLIDKAEEAGIPVIFFNREPVSEDLSRWDQVYYVGAKGEESGVLQGQILLDAWLNRDPPVDKNGDGVLQYVMLEGEPGHQDAMLRTKYAIQTLTGAGVTVDKLAGDTANWDRNQAAARVTDWVGEFGNTIEAVISNNDDMALGAIDAYRALEVAPEEMPVIVGVDATEPALQAMEEGLLWGTVRNDAQGIAQNMLDLALLLADGKDPADSDLPLVGGKYIWLPYERITLREVQNQNTGEEPTP